MNRQYCILIYSKSSPACQKLFGYIESLPFDVMNATGMTPCCADNKTMKDSLGKTGVSLVPSLLIKYFNNAQQQLQGDDIYQWIVELARTLGYTDSNNDNEAIMPTTVIPEVNKEEDDEIRTTKGVRGSMLTQALNMQKSREHDLTSKKMPP